MLIQNLIYRKNQNALQDAGDLDGQILSDLRAVQANLRHYQAEHLDKEVKGRSNHYEQWTEENCKKLAWLDRLIRTAEAGMGAAPGTHDRFTQAEWEALMPQFRAPAVLAIALRATGAIRSYLKETVYVEKQSFHPDDWYLWSVAACREEGAGRVWDCWTLNLTTGSMNGGHYGLGTESLRNVLAAKKGAVVCGPGEYPEKIEDHDDQEG